MIDSFRRSHVHDVVSQDVRDRYQVGKRDFAHLAPEGWKAGRLFRSNQDCRLRLSIHVAECGLHRRDELAVVERLGEPSQRLRGLRTRFHRRIGRRRSEDAADAEALKDLERRVDTVPPARQIDVHQHQLGPAIHRRPDRIVRGDDGAHDFVSSVEQRALALMSDEMIVLDDENARASPGSGAGWPALAVSPSRVISINIAIVHSSQGSAMGAHANRSSQSLSNRYLAKFGAGSLLRHDPPSAPRAPGPIGAARVPWIARRPRLSAGPHD